MNSPFHVQGKKDYVMEVKIQWNCSEYSKEYIPFKGLF